LNEIAITTPAVPSLDVPGNSVRLRNLGMGANIVMSHILHFYHLVALDYVDVNGTGLIPKGFLCPNYDNSYYGRGIDPVGVGGAVYTVNDVFVNNIPHGSVFHGDLTPYLAGQYVRALKFRRMAQQVGAMFTGKMPIASAYTPGCMTTKVYDPDNGGADDALARKFRELMFTGPGSNGIAGTHPLNGSPVTKDNPHPESILGFIGKPTDFLNWQVGGYLPQELPLWAKAGVPAAGGDWKEYTGTMLFDVVAAAHLFPEYFWIGTGAQRFLAWGAFEQGAGLYADGKLLHRARVHVRKSPPGDTGPVAGEPIFYVHDGAEVNHLQVKEFVFNSWYQEPSGNYNKGRHPFQGKTKPKPERGSAYTYAKTPRYLNYESDDTYNEKADHPNKRCLPYEVGPLARGMANTAGIVDPVTLDVPPAALSLALAGDAYVYFPGILNKVGYGLTPAYGDAPPGGNPNPAVWYGDFPNCSSYKSNYVGDGVIDRIGARALETLYIAKAMVPWFKALDPSEAPVVGTEMGEVVDNGNGRDVQYGGCITRKFDWNNGEGPVKTAPKRSKGAGLTEAPRGALGHWLKIGSLASPDYKGKVKNYQIITPTAWNVSPKDPDNDVKDGTLGLHGPIEESIQGAPVLSDAEPIEILRIIHSFDPCIACTVHVMNEKGEKVADAHVAASV